MTGPLTAGAARVDITPPMPVPLAGYPVIHVTREGPQDHVGYTGRNGCHQGIHDPVQARALAVDDGERLAVIVCLDVCATPRAFTDRVRTAAAARWGIDPDAVVIAASHNHSGPDFTGHWEAVDPSVAEFVLEMVLSAIGQALARSQPARLGVGLGNADLLTVNRRDPDRPTHGGMPVLRLEDLSGEAIAVLFSFACHPVIVGPQNRLVSAEYPGTAASIVENATGGVCLFLNGAAGNVNPVAFPYRTRRNVVLLSREAQALGRPTRCRTIGEMRRFGSVLGAEVLRVAATIDAVAAGAVRFWRRDVDAALKDPVRLAEFLDHVPHAPTVDEQLRQLGHVRTEVAAVRIGPLALLLLPGEPFAEIGLDLEDVDTGEGFLRVVGYANDYPGYLLPPEQYRENRYETVATPLSESGAQSIIEAAASLRDLVMNEYSSQSLWRQLSPAEESRWPAHPLV